MTNGFVYNLGTFMNKRFTALFLFLTIFINNSFCDDDIRRVDLVDDQYVEHTDEIAQAFNDFLQKQEEVYPGQDIMGGYQDAMLKVIEHQIKMLETLPEVCRQDVINTWETWVALVDKLKQPTDFFAELCYSISQKVGQDQRLENFTQVLDKITDFLNSRDLALALQFGFFDEPTKEIVNSLVDQLDMVFDDTYKLLPNLSDDLDFLYECLLSLKNQDLRTFSLHKLEILKPEVDEAINKLKSAQTQLEELNKKLQDSDKDLKEAVDFWQQSLKQFDELKDGYQNGSILGKEASSGKWLSILTKLAPYIKNGYHLYNNFFQLFKYDNKGKSLYKFEFSKLLKFQFADAFKVNLDSNLSKPAVLGAFLVDKAWSSLLVPINLLETIKGKASSSSYNSMVVKQLMWQFIATCQVLIYYNTMHKHFLKDGQKIDGFRMPNEYKPFQKMLWYTGKGTADLGAYYIENRIKNNVDSDTLEKIDDYSLGIIRPELIKFSVDTALPIMAHRHFPKDIANLKKERVFKPDPWDWHYVGRTDFANMSDAEFIENRVLGYLAVSMGYHFGKSIAYRNRDLLKSGLGKVGKFLLVKMGILEKEIVDRLPEYKDLILDEIKFLISEKEDAMFVSARQIFFAFLVQFGVVKKVDIDNLELAIEKDRLDEVMLSEFADKIISNIADSIVKQVGGGLGAWGSWHAANLATRSYGPFFAGRVAA